MKKIKIVKTETFARFVNVVNPQEGKPNRIQAVHESGKLVTERCSDAIFDRVLGERKGEKGERFHLGLRQLTQVKFRAHFDKDNVIQAVDIIPNRMFVSGAAPRVAGDNIRRGFDIHEDDSINGYDVRSEDSRTGEVVRVAYAGLDELTLCKLLDELRNATWSASKRSQTLAKHRFERIEDGLFRCRPVEDVKYTT